MIDQNLDGKIIASGNHQGFSAVRPEFVCKAFEFVCKGAVDSIP